MATNEQLEQLTDDHDEIATLKKRYAQLGASIEFADVRKQTERKAKLTREREAVKQRLAKLQQSVDDRMSNLTDREHGRLAAKSVKRKKVLL